MGRPKRMNEQTRINYTNRSCLLASKMFYNYQDFAVLEKKWMELFNIALILCGVGNKERRKQMWKEPAVPTKSWMESQEEKGNRTIDEMIYDWVGDCFYCCDRWCPERVARCHWMYQQIKGAIHG